jgi:CubicO group peptidase (beta-lactamase class C family)
LKRICWLLVAALLLPCAPVRAAEPTPIPPDVLALMMMDSDEEDIYLPPELLEMMSVVEEETTPEPTDAPSLAPLSPTPPLPEDHAVNAERFNAILRQYKAVGASVVLIQGGEIVDVYHYGKANRADNIPVTDSTLFRIASVSKMVSAVGLLSLMEAGWFDLDEDVGKYYGFSVRNPAFPRDKITIRQIMTHTASLLDGGHYKRALNGDIVRLESVFNGTYASTDFARQRPGTKSVYSNFGGGLLGSLMELFTGLSVDEWMARAVFRPLGLTATYFTPNLPEGATIARIYDVDVLGVVLDSMKLTYKDASGDFERHYTYTAGGLSISAMDLAKVLILIAGDGSLDGQRILAPETVQEMRTLQNNIGSVLCESGRGLNLNIIPDSIVKGRTLYGHQGKAYGMICAAYCDPTDQTGIVLLTNGCDTSTVNSIARIARDIIRQGYDIIDAHP